MKKTIGIAAHVDAGKTTFSEQLLFRTGRIREAGRVDHQTSCLDTHSIEKARGITIFADQAVFSYRDDTYYLLDTPGHVDFSAETERAMAAMDAAVLLINGSAGVQAHTITLFRLLARYQVPVLFFFNKTDLEGYRRDLVLDELKTKCGGDYLFLKDGSDIRSERAAEFAAERDDALLEAYLEGNLRPETVKDSLRGLVRERRCFPVCEGSALKGTGVGEFLEVLSELTETSYEKEAVSPFLAEVYKIRYDDKGNRVTYMKLKAGRLLVRQEFRFPLGDGVSAEKVNEIRVYQGKKYETRDQAEAGDLVAVTGLRTPGCGWRITKAGCEPEERYQLAPALQAAVRSLDGADPAHLMEALHRLDEEDPMLSVNWQRATGEILVHVMGKIQLEVLEQLMRERFGMAIEFLKPEIPYRETIEKSVAGYGHFEPLRHFAEVQVRLDPGEPGSGITFSSECSLDSLSQNYQHLVEVHVKEKEHAGILTGSPLTDVRVVLLHGRAHEKHTEGGDFREATYRAVRQALEKSQSVVLEPWYHFDIYVEAGVMGRVMTDITKRSGECRPPRQEGDLVHIEGEGPVETFLDYSSELISFTGGRGSISLMPDGYRRCHNEAEVIAAIGYDKEADTENPSSSVFCAKGLSFLVPWQEAEQYISTKAKEARKVLESVKKQ